MDGVVGLLAALVVLVALGWSLSSAAGRLDRLHTRVDSSRAVLEARLAERAATAEELATSGLLDPASAVLLADAAGAAREATSGEDGREPIGGLAQSSLTEALDAVLSPEAVAELCRSDGGRLLLDDLARACTRASLARRFHNDAVAQTRRIRRKRVVRWLRLAGHTALPDTVELDDDVPRTLVGAGLSQVGGRDGPT